MSQSFSCLLQNRHFFFPVGFLLLNRSSCFQSSSSLDWLSNITAVLWHQINILYFILFLNYNNFHNMLTFQNFLNSLHFLKFHVEATNFWIRGKQWKICSGIEIWNQSHEKVSSMIIFAVRFPMAIFCYVKTINLRFNMILSFFSLVSWIFSQDSLARLKNLQTIFFLRCCNVCKCLMV